MPDGIGPTLDQRRARHAWDAVARIKAKDEKKKNAQKTTRASDRKDDKPSFGSGYAREAKRLPIRILTAGLGHALAFLNAKANKAEASTDLLRDVADWALVKRDGPDSTDERPAADALIEEIVRRDATFLQVAADEVLAYLHWLTRFAEAEFGADDD